MENADPTLVHEESDSLKRMLEKRHGDNQTSKLAHVTRLVERVKNGSVPAGMSAEACVALFQVFADLQFNGKAGLTK